LVTDEVLEGNKKGSLFSIVHGALDLLLKKSNLEFSKDYRLVPNHSDFYFPGQQFKVEAHGKELASLGVVHPKVLAKFGWTHPTAVWELDAALL
jgi:phenylalanyl-tRNA synthetase beta subunit